ncbi:MAG: DUF6629 family protein [Acidimicrobiales bacterium]
MCFSAQADLLGGLVVGAIGIDVVRNVDHRSRLGLLAALPLLLAAHQLDEAVVWWALQGRVAWEVGRVAVWIYLLFAFVVLPVYVPVAVLVLEPPGRRRRIMAPFVALGVLVAAILLVAMVRGPVSATLGDYHIAYSTGLGAGGVIVALYVVAVCGSMLLSSYQDVAIFAIVNLIAVAALARLTLDGLASLWCGWAAVTSGAIALHVRYAGRRGQLPQAMT